MIIRKNDKVFLACRPSANGASGEDGGRFFRLPSSFRALFEDEMPDQVGHDAKDGRPAEDAGCDDLRAEG